jgi:glycosyltransferase involved in cell wall biosynthesis
MKKYLKRPYLKEMAPWIDSFINLYKNTIPLFELHIIAPNYYTNTNIAFVKDGIHYNLFKFRSNLIPKKIYNLIPFDYLTNFYNNKKEVYKFIRKINPDVVHLFGAENAYYSSTILPIIDKYKILLTVQGFIKNESKKNFINLARRRIEKEIITKINNVAVDANFIKDEILNINKNANIFWHKYPVYNNKKYSLKYVNKIYDCVFFARVCEDKGINDLIDAIALVKEKNKNVSLCIIGDVKKRFLIKLKRRCESLNLSENIIFKGFLQSQDDVHNEAIKAKMCVLPTHHDNIPGCITESMLLKLPVVTYNVGGIPDLNKEHEAVILVKKGDIETLSKKIILLMNNKDLRIKIANTAYKIAKKKFNNKKIIKQFNKIYNKIK